MSRRSTRRQKNLPSESIQLTIERLSHEGRGIASNNGKVAFVDNGLPGEIVTARYIKSKSRFDELVAETVITSSPHRTDPGCKFFGVCGGCSLQHLSTQAQIEFKQALLIEQLSHATGLDESTIPLLEILQAEPYRYRRKARLAVRFVSKKGGTLIGFREKSSSFITQMNFCEVLEKPLADLIEPLTELVDELDAKFSIPQFEVAVGELGADEKQVALVMRHLEPLSESDLQQIKAFSDDRHVDFYLQPKGVETIHQIWPDNGLERLCYQLPEFGLTFKFHPSDFVQVNGAINRLIVKRAIDLLDLKADETVLDLFCGLGNFTLPLASLCSKAIGVEGSETMVGRARENAEYNGLDNVEFYVSNLYEGLGSQPWGLLQVDKVLLDPPRSGALEVIDHIASLKAEKIVYISCNPATLSRDASRLLDKGYRLGKVGVIDMFPHTSHVESMAEFILGHL